MGARSHKDQFIRALKKHQYQRASFEELAIDLGPKWTAEKVEAKARVFDADDNVPISVVRGGVSYFGTETARRPGIYRDIKRGIERRWAADNGMRRISAMHTSRHASRGMGDWTQPDLVVQVRRRSDANPPVVYLALEIEQPKGFSIVSIYQAYELGRGADYSWVFYSGRKCTGPTWKQIEVAARDLGVGVVHAARPTAPAQWDTQIKARERDPSERERELFFDRCELDPRYF